MASIYVTAFGPFAGVEVNPTEELLADLQARWKSQPLGCSWDLLGTKVLPVSAKQVDAWLETDLYGSIFKDVEDCPVVIHLGVDVEATKIKLETYACNEASFRVPDCDGWQPQEEPISQSHPFKSKLITEVPVRVIAGMLETRGFPVEQSFDAGRFVCNYTYYQSMRLASQASRPVQALFVHVPRAEAMPLQRQKEVLWEILRELAETMTGALEVGGSADLLNKIQVERWPSVLRAMQAGCCPSEVA